MKEMSDTDELEDSNGEDTYYYRTKWPWPLKDRDYTLARRCQVVDDNRAIVYISKSIEVNCITQCICRIMFLNDIYKMLTSVQCDEYPAVKGVIRVNNYWCHSVLLSTKSG
jgi:hypothetical protein